MDEKKEYGVRAIFNMNLENWREFKLLAIKLGYTHAQFFDELLRYYVASQPERIKQLTDTIQIKIRQQKQEIVCSLALSKDLELIKETMEKNDVKQVENQLTYLAMEYVPENKHPKEDIQAARNFLALGNDWVKQKKAEMKKGE